MGTLLEDPGKLLKFSEKLESFWDDHCLSRQVRELCGLASEWREEKGEANRGERIVSGGNELNALRGRLKRQCLLQQMRDELVLEHPQRFVEREKVRRWLRKFPRLRDHIGTHYHCYVLFQMVLGAALGISQEQVVED